MSKQITISNLTVGYNNDALLSNINITTNSNQLIAIIGRNGTGKSTLLKTLSGTLPNISGSFNVDNKNILTLPETKRAKLLSLVTTKPESVNNITVKDFVSFGRYPYTNWLGIGNKDDNTTINEAIALCNITELSNRDYQTLSDGEKQRVNIARSIAQNTPLIILDEPTAHLDLVNKIEIFKLLKTLTEIHNKTIIFSSHQIEYALQACNEIWLINNQEINNYTPTQLIENNLLNEIIKSKDIIFDKTSKTFKLQ
ncbi:MAG: ABC transporter ATP-binding protein [Vicingaceae bacterium]|nr:ABC transporter ATP-binding protein [Vicingaceae bacterium]